MSDTKALEILEKEDGTYLSIQGKRYSAMILLGHSEMAHNAILELAAELAQLRAENAGLKNKYARDIGLDWGYSKLEQLRTQLAQAQEAVEEASKYIKCFLEYMDDGSEISDTEKEAAAWLSAHEVKK